MRTKNVLLLAAFIATVCATAARADIPIVQADTIFAGFPGGEVSGIVFGPTGETVIVMHDAQLVEINIKTKQVLREFEKVPNGVSSNPSLFICNQNSCLGAKVYSDEYFGEKNISGIILWNLQTGKMVKSLPHLVLQTNGVQYYSLFIRNDQKYLGKYDINTFIMVDSVYLPKDQTGDGYAEWRNLGIIPNSNKVLIGANRYNEYTQGQKEYILAELYLLDFDTKKLTKIPIPYESGQKSSEIYQIKVSEKYVIVGITITGYGRIFYFFDHNFNLLYKLTKQDFVNMTDIISVSTTSVVTSIMDDNMIFYLSNENLSRDRMAFYNIQEKRVTKYLGFLGGGVYDKTSRKIALLGTINGLIGLYDLYSLPVKDLTQEFPLNINYSNNQLEYTSDKAFVGESTIYDTTGKMILRLGTQPFLAGKNIIRINQPLPLGVYILTIKDNTSQSSYKFIVE
jgi:hypothetical protein